MPTYNLSKNPTTLTTPVVVTGDAVVGSGTTAWQVTNQTTLTGNGSGATGVGINLGAGTVTNTSTGHIYGYSRGIDIVGSSGGTGTVGNAGSITANATHSFAGVLIEAGGSVGNSNFVQGGTYGVDIAGATGTVTNTGTIEAAATPPNAGNLGAGVDLSAGGNVVNGPSNATTALIEGVYRGVVIGNGSGTGTLTNFGTIQTTAPVTGTNSASVFGVDFGSGGKVINGASGSTAGLIRGGYNGIFSGSGPATVTNFGTIAGTGTGLDFVAGIKMLGGSITNGASNWTSPVIEGQNFGIQVPGAAGTVVNFGTVEALVTTGSSSIGIDLTQGGLITNGASNSTAALIEGGAYGVRGSTNAASDSGATTLVNFGSIAATETATTNDGPAQVYAIELENVPGNSAANYGTVTSTGVGVYLSGGQLTNGQAGHSALVKSVYSAVLGGGSNPVTIANFGTIESTATATTGAFPNLFLSGIAGEGGGVQVTTGAVGTKTALVEGSKNGIYVYGSGRITNFGTVQSTGGSGVGVYIVPNSSGPTNGTVVNYGSIGGYIGVELTGDGTAGNTLINSGTITGSDGPGYGVEFGGTNNLLELKPGYSITGGVTAAAGSTDTLELSGSAGSPVTVDFSPASFANFGTVEFAPGTGNYATLTLAGSLDIPGTISGFTGPHDVVDLPFVGDTNNDATLMWDPTTHTITVAGDNGAVAVLNLDPNTDYTGISYVPVSDRHGGTDVEMPCFCAGTRLLTPSGEVPVEDLRVGDDVTTLSGATRPIAWIGSGRSLVTPANGRSRPIVVRAGAIADGVPRRDLHVTKGHSLYFDGVLIPVEFLVNGRSILWDEDARVVEFYHIELPSHDVLIADGAPAESYKEDGNRDRFHNVDRPVVVPAPDWFAPVLTGGPAVERVWRILLARTGFTAPALTSDPDLHLVADGRRIEPERAEDGVYTFRLGWAPLELRLASRSAVPLAIGRSHDPRRLGVAIRSIELCADGVTTALSYDSPALVDGFQDAEFGRELRWTNGDGVVPGRALFAFDGPVTVTVQLADRLDYPVAVAAESTPRIAA
ncbi:MAG: Hint domain-containing protein [Alphaproteobacteria bacterium]|nr:Hint domain-containing protein [Alphaproteobacteria bacterium]